MRDSKPMQCTICGTALRMNREASTETTTLGAEFEEVHECPGCGETGRVVGTVGQPPARWSKRGRVFSA